MKNFTAGKSTIIGTIEKDTPFKKAKDFVGEYSEKEMRVLGYIKTHSDMYNKDQYSLYVDYQNSKMLLNVPSWYGEKLEEDFNESGIAPDRYFANAYIRKIETFQTKYNTASLNILIY